MQALKKLVIKALRDTADKIDAGNCELTESELLDKLVEEAVNYLDDADNPYSTEKIWKYLNSSDL